MHHPYASETDSFLLAIDENEFAAVAALLGLRARPVGADDQVLVDAYLNENDLFSGPREPLRITTVPDVLPQ